MSQKTNLNLNPYFDDFSESEIGAKDKNYYKVLFNPGRAVQARELNTLQSILQDQVESFGNSIFKDGSVVIPGGITYDGQFHAVKLNPLQYGIDIENYINQYIGKKIIGRDSGVSASVKLVQLPNSEVEYITLYVKYNDSDSNFEISSFKDNESLYVEEDVAYQSSVISAGTPFASTISTNATSIGSAVSINYGIYFIRGSFVRVAKQTIILDYYTNSPSYRVGLKIDEQIITSSDDSSLYDNAKGFTNYAAPGADRFKISLTLTKRFLTDNNDTDFVELLRIEDGTINKLETKTTYSNIRDYLAQRTYDESGNYVVTPFDFSLNNSLNNRLGNDGLFFDTEKTSEGNTPSDDLMCVKISPGKAYVKGYDIEKTGIEIVDLPKPRTKQSTSSVSIPFEMGNLLRVNNVSGAPLQKQIIYLQGSRKNSNLVGSGNTVGSARVYNFNLTDATYSNASTSWDLYLYDIQTYTELFLNQAISSSQLPASSFVKGKSSGASGYATFSGDNSTKISLSQTSGSFIVGEQITINNVELYPRTISSIKVYTGEDIKSTYQPTSISGFSTSFLCDIKLKRTTRQETITISASGGGTISTATISSPYTFAGIKTDNIIRYQKPGITTETYNKVVSIDPSLVSMTLQAVSDVPGVSDGSLPTTQYSGPYALGVGRIRNVDKGFLYAELPNSNISSTDLSASTIIFSAQSTGSLTPSGKKLTVNTSNFNLGISTSSAKFAAFDAERYSIFYADGTIDKLTSDEVVLSADSSQVTFSNVSNKLISVINATFVKNAIQSKVKQFNRSKVINVTFSKNPESGTGINTSIDDGLTYNQYYGLRVQDEEISLNYPDVSDVIAIYESLDKNAPVLNQLSFSSLVNVDTNAIIGENIIGKISNAVARIVSKPSTNTLGIIYLNTHIFSDGEDVIFEESNINTQISSIIPGKFKNVTNKFSLDKNQKDQYYDYSKIIRNSGESPPSRKLLIVFDYYSVPANDTGDVFTVDSYTAERYSSDIPYVGKNNIRVTDTLDFRPRVSVFTSTSSSPFDFNSRSFGTEPKIILSPNESALIGYQFYLGRIDKLFLDKNGMFTISQGDPSTNPKDPDKPSDVIEIATFNLPPYLYSPKDIKISLVDNKRYTMRDIGKIEDRVENLERVTSLSLLELNTQTLQIKDAQGISRFKTGFFVDDFKNSNLINLELSEVNIDSDNKELTTKINSNSLTLKPVTSANITDENLDLSTDFDLFDSNVQKTGDAITLKYKSVGWIEQLFATTVENVNPFQVTVYNGNVKLTPASDTWVRTIRLSNVYESYSQKVSLNGGWKIYKGSSTSTSSRDVIRETGSELYMRSRNTGFTVVNLKSLTRYYQFLDGNGSVDFIPKLVEIASDSSLQNYGSSSAFKVGEKVIGYVKTSTGVLKSAISFRVAQSNHKVGPFNKPTYTYTLNPYASTESIPSEYSSSSKTLNIDINSLCAEAQGLYSGYLSVGMKLIGQTSGAVSYVKDLRLISDENGFVSGSFFLKDPNTKPKPTVRISTGSKTYKLSSSSTNETPLEGSSLISSGETIYKSQGTWEEVQKIITTVTTNYYADPLAQSFTVGGVVSSDVSNGNKPSEDVNGAYLTAVDLFFAHKDSGNAPVSIEIRTVELGTPTRKILGNPVTLQPNQVEVSSDASVATKVTFDYPIYLEPNLEYAIVILAPQTDQYEVWTAIRDTKTVETKNLPDTQSIKYTSQYLGGSLFKSQNGSIWTANQNQDLKFKLYKAKFTAKTGSAYFHNPTLNESNTFVPKLNSDPLVSLPKQIKVGITTVQSSSTIGILTTGRKVSPSNALYKYGYIVGTGSSASSVGVTTGGINYSTGTVTASVETYNINSNGSGLKLNITANNGVVTGAAVSSLYPGNGYAVGDTVGIVTSTFPSESGSSSIITISTISGVDTLYLSNVQGKSFVSSGISSLTYYDNSGNSVSLAGTNVISSTDFGGFVSGNFIGVNHYNHGMYAKNNKVTLYNVGSNVPPTKLSKKLSKTDTSISIDSTSDFSTFEGLGVSSSNPGFVMIGNEIIKYTSVSTGLLSGIVRGIDSTSVGDFDTDLLVYKYELNGVSLRRINKTHDISDVDIDIDSYYLEIDMTSFDANATDRSIDVSASNSPQLSFNSNSTCGGSEVLATENIQFNSITPQAYVINPSTPTSTTAEIRTVSGTSVSGNETSFVDQGYETVELGKENKLSSTRIVCSNINEQTYLSSLLRNKSFTLKLNLSTTDENVSPLILCDKSSVKFNNNRLNSPIKNYITDNRVNSISDDPHAAVYVSNTVKLSNTATSLKVIVSAYRHSSSDFRVLYSLIRADSSEVAQSFELFPGYDNLNTDTDQDGFLDVIDRSKNSGLPDTKVSASLNDEFVEYNFGASNLGDFIGYTIKIVMSGTNQAHAPRFKDLRSIALA
jgi:hypothetical protein